MGFQATPLNVVILLLIAFAIYTLSFLAKGRFDSNLPLVFYVALIAFINISGQNLVNVYLFCGGLLAALILRFEFMNGVVTRVIWVAAMGAVAGIAFQFLRALFDLRLPRF